MILYSLNWIYILGINQHVFYLSPSTWYRVVEFAWSKIKYAK